MIKLAYLTDKKNNEWDSFVTEAFPSTFYHKVSWKEHVENTYGYTPIYMFAHEGEEIIAIAPFFLVKSIIFGNRLISLPFTYFGGFCFKKGIDERSLKDVFSLFFDELKKKANRKSICCIEIRNWDTNYNKFLPELKINFMTPFINFQIKLREEYNSLFLKYRRNIRRNLSNNKDSLRIRECSNKKELMEIFEIYSLNIRKFGSPPLSKQYFISEWDVLKVKKLFFAFIAEVNSRIVGGITVLCNSSQVYAEHIASLPKYDYLHIKERLYDYTIRWACKSGYEIYNFCRCRKDSGVYHHKQGWGGEEAEIDYLHVVYGRAGDYLIDYNQTRLGLCKLIFKYIPSSLQRTIGPFVRREIAQ